MRVRILDLVLGLSLTMNVVQGVVVWTNATMIEQLGGELERVTAAVRPLVARNDETSRAADELSDQLKECRLTNIKRVLGMLR
jgi:hypothetical protein